MEGQGYAGSDALSHESFVELNVIQFVSPDVPYPEKLTSTMLKIQPTNFMYYDDTDISQKTSTVLEGQLLNIKFKHEI